MLNKDKCLKKYHHSLLCWDNSMTRSESRPKKSSTLTNMPLLNNKKELQSFLGITNYLSKFSPTTAEVFQPLQKLTSLSQTGNETGCTKICMKKQRRYSKKDAWMKFYRVAWPLYLETNASGIGLRARLLQKRDGMNWRCDEIPDNAILHPTAFASKSLFSAEWHGTTAILLLWGKYLSSPTISFWW